MFFVPYLPTQTKNAPKGVNVSKKSNVAGSEKTKREIQCRNEMFAFEIEKKPIKV